MELSGNDLSGSLCFAPRITIDYETIRPVIEAWSKKVIRMAVFEHEKDDSVSQTHCHLLMLGCSVAAEQFKRMFKRILPGVDTGGGNAFWKWESSRTTIDDQFLTYMSKGSLRPKFVKGFSPALVEERRQQWVMPIPKDVKSSKSDMCEDLIKEFFAKHTLYDIKLMDLDEVRFWMFNAIYRKTCKAPHATQYKQYASTLWLEVGKKVGKFGDYSRQIFNLWY